MSTSSLQKYRPHNNNKPVGRLAFSLLRYFSIASLIAIVISALLLGLFYRQVSVNELVGFVEHNNRVLTKSLSNTLWPEFRPFLAQAEHLSDQALRQHPEIKKFNLLVINQVRETPILKITIFDVHGRVLFSTENQQIGGKDDDDYFDGKNATLTVVSSLLHKDRFNAIDGPLNDLEVVSSYLPIVNENKVEGVFEVYYNVTPELSNIKTKQIFIFFGVALILLVLYGFLFAIVRRADQIMKHQSSNLTSYLDEIENAKAELEQRVTDRTKELNSAVQELREHKNHLEELVKERTNDLAKARDQALEASKTKSAFLANMSHELRTPLNAIIGYSEILLEEAMEVKANPLLMDIQKIHIAGKHLLALINDILDISKIEAGKMENYIETMELAPTIKGIADSIKPLLLQNNNRIAIDLAPDVSTMDTDITKFRQILFNLISNGSKFTKDGLVTINVRKETDDDKHWIMISVKDTGIGMNAEQKGRLFQAFTQADSSTTRKYGGTGLGLTISKRLCELLGGTIFVESAVNSGSTFIAKLPLATPKSPEQDSKKWFKVGPKVDPVGVRLFMDDGTRIPRREKVSTVLVIDDDANIRDLMERFLSRQGFHVQSAANAEEGLELARTLRPDLITLDVMMPERDGWSVLTELKRDPAVNDIPVIMLTLVEDREVGFALGAADYLHKPIDRNQLAETISRHVRPAHQAIALVVQPNESHARALAEMLKHDGFDARLAFNGKDAIDKMAAEAPDIIITDLAMPYMDGFQLIDEIQKHEQWKKIPILAITADDISENKKMYLNRRVERILYNKQSESDDIINDVHDMIVSMLRSKNRRGM